MSQETRPQGGVVSSNRDWQQLQQQIKVLEASHAAFIDRLAKLEAELSHLVAVLKKQVGIVL
jgi:uncharacterized protein involved in exopolysaccharide biosynthesis